MNKEKTIDFVAIFTIGVVAAATTTGAFMQVFAATYHNSRQGYNIGYPDDRYTIKC